MRGPTGLDAHQVEQAALKKGVVIEPGAVHFMAQPGPANFIRLGVSLDSHRADRGRHQAAGGGRPRPSEQRSACRSSCALYPNARRSWACADDGRLPILSHMKLLTINAGSSSLKFATFELAALPVCEIRGQLSGIGQGECRLFGFHRRWAKTGLAIGPPRRSRGCAETAD